MGEPFRRSAAFYDALYSDLPTTAECAAVLAVFAERGLMPRSLVDLGCGTGRHAAELSRRGLEVVGIDRSPEMVALARSRGVNAHPGDLVSVRIGRTFDAATAFFNVVSYLVSDGDLALALETARVHLEPGGLFSFDAWSVSAVDRVPPQKREKVVLHEGHRVLRRASPTCRGDLVEVRYDFDVEGLQFSEVHLLRPRSVATLSAAAQGAGFRVLTTSESPTSYDIRVLAQAI